MTTLDTTWWTWTLQLAFLLLSLMFWLLTIRKTRDLFHVTVYVQLLLLLSTLAATLVLLVPAEGGVSLRDELRAIAVRPEVLLAQWAIWWKIAPYPSGESLVDQPGNGE